MARRSASAGLHSQPHSQQSSMDELQALLRYRFQRPELLQVALTHRSYVYDAAIQQTAGELADPSRDNEQLEFVGDAALGLLAAEAMCRRFPASREGELTRLRASVVSRKHLGQVGTRLNLGRWLRLGHTAEKNDGRSNATLFANTVEALIAALYLDGGIEAARRFVEEEVLGEVLPGLERSLAEGAPFSGAVGDHKSALQEILQAEGSGRPHYRLVDESGPDHRRVFRVEVWLPEGDDAPLAAAEGSTKKQAQQEAARLAVQRLLQARAQNGTAALTAVATGVRP